LRHGIKKIEYNSNKDYLIFNTDNKEIIENEIVVFNIKEWKQSVPEAKVLKRIGKKGEVNNEIHAYLRRI
jgi:exoribonuclease R